MSAPSKWFLSRFYPFLSILPLVGIRVSQLTFTVDCDDGGSFSRRRLVEGLSSNINTNYIIYYISSTSLFARPLTTQLINITGKICTFLDILLKQPNCSLIYFPWRAQKDMIEENNYQICRFCKWTIGMLHSLPAWPIVVHLCSFSLKSTLPSCFMCCLTTFMSTFFPTGRCVTNRFFDFRHYAQVWVCVWDCETVRVVYCVLSCHSRPIGIQRGSLSSCCSHLCSLGDTA